MRRVATAVLFGVWLIPIPAHASTWYVPPVRGPVIRHFEPPPSPYSAGHRGIDIAAAYGSTVVASASGIVSFAGSVAGQKFVSVDHPDGIRTTYSYLSSVLVGTKQLVMQRDPIGLSGFGHPGATDPHLHFGMKRGEQYLDPEPYLVQGFRHDYSDLVRLVPVGPPVDRVALPPLIAGLGWERSRSRRRGNRSPSLRTTRMRSSSASGAVAPVPIGAHLASSPGP